MYFYNFNTHDITVREVNRRQRILKGAIKNEKSRDNGKGHKTHNEEEQKTQHRKLKDEQHRPHQKHRGLSVPAYKTPSV